jgi:hypothetical protein
MKMFLPILAVLLLLLGGCATADFTPYRGAQQEWPVAAGAFVETKYEVPVYHGAPDRPYRVLGYLTADTAPVRRFAGGVASFMARRAQELGGDALILLDKHSEYSGTFNTFSATGTTWGNTTTVTGTGNSFAMFRGKGSGVVIKFAGARRDATERLNEADMNGGIIGTSPPVSSPAPTRSPARMADEQKERL